MQDSVMLVTPVTPRAWDRAAGGVGGQRAWRSSSKKSIGGVSHSLEPSSISLLPSLSIRSVPLRIAGTGAIWRGGGLRGMTEQCEEPGRKMRSGVGWGARTAALTSSAFGQRALSLWAILVPV